nr:type VII secretion-associated serine protease mycosin [Mycobacterium sp. E2497]
MSGSSRRAAARMCAAVLVAGAGIGVPAPASAIRPPVVEPGPPPAGPPLPPQPSELKALCGVPTGVLAGTDFRKQTSADAMLNYRSAWRFSRGAGQKVAVIDTGVNRHPRLHALEGGGDYVSTTDGLADCDAHGTLVAGLIAAAPDSDDSFAGVAPDAAILSIRQNSSVYGPVGGANNANDPNATSTGYGDTATLALAVTRAVDLGATVVNISEAACAAVGTGLDDAGLGRAVRYAFDRNVVVVAAAGNVSAQSRCASQNSQNDPNQPMTQGWDTVQTIATPAWFSDYVLAVGAVTTSALPADFSLHGPWLAVAAPGENITSLDANGPGLVDAELAQRGLMPLNGTSFAAPLVSGVVALIRSRFPQLTAQQVMELVKRTAHTPGDGPNPATGYGVVDPVAALTYQLPPPQTGTGSERAASIGRGAQPDSRKEHARTVVFGVTAASLAVMAAAAALAAARRRSR